ncbi:MAG: hypothetical protein LCH84_14535 [Gemmatimonadetes bacterium]|nr:hypothetical protein [Gemmatimonadota bacterium]
MMREPMLRFPTMLRARPGTIVVGDVPAGVEPWTLRVQAAEAWDAVSVLCLPTTTVYAVKQAAMAALLPDVTALEDQVVKLHGYLVQDESRSLQAVGAQDASTLFLAPRRRRPLL